MPTWLRDIRPVRGVVGFRVATVARVLTNDILCSMSIIGAPHVGSTRLSALRTAKRALAVLSIALSVIADANPAHTATRLALLH